MEQVCKSCYHLTCLNYPLRLNQKKGKFREVAEDPDVIASALIAIGSPIWKLISNISNIDFLLSINEQKFSMMFNFFENTRWLLLTIFGAVWLLLKLIRRNHSRTKEFSPSWGLVGAIGVMVFIFAVLITVRSTGSVPNVVMRWGGQAGACNGVFDSSRLVAFKQDYKVALVCGAEDPTTDRLQDKKVTFSNVFTITGGPIAITALYRPATLEYLKKASPVSHVTIPQPGGRPPIQVPVHAPIEFGSIQ